MMGMVCPVSSDKWKALEVYLNQDFLGEEVWL